MNNQIRMELKKRKVLFATLMIIGYAVYWISVAVNNSNNLVYYFVHDTHNTFMDLFNPITKEAALTYIEPYYSNYPALGNLFFAIIRNMLPENLRSDAAEMQGNMLSLIYLIIFLIGCVLIIEKLIKSYLRGTEEKGWVNSCVAYVILMSGPFLFCYERGNNLLWALIFLMIFVLYYENESPVLREIALICLAISAALKIYPAVFGILLLKKGNMKVVLRGILYGALVMFVPFWTGYDGLESVIHFIQNIISRNGGSITLGLGYNFSFSTLVRIGFAFAGEYDVVLPAAIVLFPAFLTAILFSTSKELWKKVFAVCLFIVWIPNASYTYVICYFIIPLLLYLRECDEVKRKDIIYIIGFVLMFSLYSLPRVAGISELDTNYELSWGMVVIHIDIIAMILFILIDNIRRMVEDKKHAV